MAFSQDKWHDRDVEKLIRLVHVHPCLWNSQSDEYKNFEAREIAFSEIAKKIGVPRDEVRKKYRNLRTQYIREVRNSKTRGYLSRWMHFNSLKFLSEGQDVPNGLWDPMNWDDTQEEMERLQNTKQEACYGDIDDEDDYSEEFLEACDEIGDDGELNTADINQAGVDSVEIERTESTSTKKNRSIHYEVNQSEASATSHERRVPKRPTILLMKAPKKVRDEYTIFGEHVANELRLLKDQKHLQNSLKCKILQAILDVNRAANDGLSSL